MCSGGQLIILKANRARSVCAHGSTLSSSALLRLVAALANERRVSTGHDPRQQAPALNQLQLHQCHCGGGQCYPRRVGVDDLPLLGRGAVALCHVWDNRINLGLGQECREQHGDST